MCDQLSALQRFVDTSHASCKSLYCCFWDLKSAYEKRAETTSIIVGPTPVGANFTYSHDGIETLTRPALTLTSEGPQDLSERRGGVLDLKLAAWQSMYELPRP